MRLHRSILSALALAALAALPIAASAAPSDSGNTTFSRSGAPFTFSYPSSFQVAPYSGGTQVNKPAYQVAVALANHDYLLAQTYKLKFSVAADGSGTLKGQKVATSEVDSIVDATIKSIATKAGFTKQQRTVTGRLGAMRARVYDVARPDGSLASRIIVALSGTTEYYLACQATTKNASRIAAACTHASATFAKA
jgi:hypothetical protein